MGTIALTFLIAMISLAGIVLAAAWGANKATDLMVGNKHRLLEAITATGDVPEGWRRGPGRKAERLAARGAQSDRLLRLQENAKTTYLRRLDNLVKYAAASRLVEDEETRQLLLAQLSDVRALWEATPAGEL
jgi:hypothetical protein